MYTITPTPQNHPDLMALIAELDAYQQTLYPAELRALSAVAGSDNTDFLPRCLVPF